MTSKQPETQQEGEALIGKLLRMGVMGVATAGVGSALGHSLDGAIPTTGPVDVTGLHGGQIDTGSVMHHGPSEGGELLDRPSAGYMAHSSAGNGLEIQQGHDVSTIARDMDKAGTFTVGDHQIAVLDYMPGGDLLQMAGGSVNPGQMMMSLAQHGLQQQMEQGGSDGSVAMIDGARMPGVGTGGIASPDGFAASDQGGGAVQGGRHVPAESGEHVDGGGIADGQHAIAGITAAGRPRKLDAHGNHIPDADENARDMETLGLQHRMDLDTAVETSDQQRVHTELHAHGRTLEIDTDFEATARSNSEERAEAAEHVEEMIHAPSGEMEHSRPDMHFRSRVQAHLDAAAHDDGMSM